MIRPIAIALAASLSVPASGQSTSQQPPAAPAPAAATPDPNERICEKIKQIGSRLSVKKVCMTRAQWAEQRLADRQTIEKGQIQQGSYNTGN